MQKAKYKAQKYKMINTKYKIQKYKSTKYKCKPGPEKEGAVTRRAKVPQSAPGDAKRTSILQNTAKLSAVIQNTAKWREILHKSATQAAYIYDAK